MCSRRVEIPNSSSNSSYKNVHLVDHAVSITNFIQTYLHKCGVFFNDLSYIGNLSEDLSNDAREPSTP